MDRKEPSKLFIFLSEVADRGEPIILPDFTICSSCSSLFFARFENLLLGFSCESVVFCEQKSKSLVKKSKLLPVALKKKRMSESLIFERGSLGSRALMSLFFKEKQEQFAHSRSFVNSDTSELHTVAL